MSRMNEALRRKEVYVVHFVDAGNNCRSKMAEGVFDSFTKELRLADKLEARSSGMDVVKLKEWNPGSHFPFDSVRKILEVGDRNDFYFGENSQRDRVAVEAFFKDLGSAARAYKKEASYVALLNGIASRMIPWIGQADRSMAGIVMATEGINYPRGEAKQFQEDGSDLYIGMGKRHVENIVETLGSDEKVKCFGDFLSRDVGSSIDVLNVKDPVFSLRGYMNILRNISTGCRIIVDHAHREAEKRYKA